MERLDIESPIKDLKLSCLYIDAKSISISVYDRFSLVRIWFGIGTLPTTTTKAKVTRRSKLEIPSLS